MSFLQEAFPDSLGLGLLPLLLQPVGFPRSESSSSVQPGAYSLPGTMGMLVHSKRARDQAEGPVLTFWVAGWGDRRKTRGKT